MAAQIGKKILAPMQYDGSMDSTLFEYWFQTWLLPSLSADTVIVMDNATFHRKSRLISLAQNQGHEVLFLPPYSPELNLIERFWNWLNDFYQTIITNLDSVSFPPDELKKLYAMRWGIETSFRDLKYTCRAY